MKRSLVYAVAAVILLLGSPARAADGEGLFLQKCGACHKRGGEAPAVNPADKAGRVWQKYFMRGRHPVDIGLADSDLELVIGYLQNHAADSDHPVAAIIPK